MAMLNAKSAEDQVITTLSVIVCQLSNQTTRKFLRGLRPSRPSIALCSNIINYLQSRCKNLHTLRHHSTTVPITHLMHRRRISHITRATPRVNVPLMPIPVRTSIRINVFGVQNLPRPHIAPFRLHVLRRRRKGHPHLILLTVILLISPHGREMPWR